ncbi:MAG: carbohydrate ABC transporter permease [Anaerolineaceae bacterium]
MHRDSTLKKVLSWAGLILLLIIFLFPLYWLAATALKDRMQIMAIPPQFNFTPTLQNFKDIFFSSSGSDTNFGFFFRMSIIISALATFFSVLFGTLAAYSLSRFKVAGKDDLMFFILTTRMLPAVATLVPIFLMYRNLHLSDTIHGMVLLYTMFNLGFTVWMMKSFIDEIPVEYEEAALVDGYSRWEAFIRVVLPQSITGIAASAVFSLIASWNEFVYGSILTTRYARTIPPAMSVRVGSEGYEWGRIAATAFLYVLPVLAFTFLVRKSLLRGLTFGAIKK